MLKTLLVIMALMTYTCETNAIAAASFVVEDTYIVLPMERDVFMISGKSDIEMNIATPTGEKIPVVGVVADFNENKIIIIPTSATKDADLITVNDADSVNYKMQIRKKGADGELSIPLGPMKK